MAKQLVSPIERHVEKAVLGVAVLVLLGAVARYLVTSPNAVEVDGERVTPHTVDNFVFTKAERIRQRIRDARVEVPHPESLVADFDESVAPLAVDKPWPLVASIGVAAPFVDKAGATLGQYALVEVIQLPQPVIVSGRSTFAVEGAGGQMLYLPANWVTGSVVVDVGAQSKAQRLAYGATRAGLVYGPVDAQRRKQRGDGTWSDDDWETVEPWVQYAPPPDEPEVKLTDTGGRVELDPSAIRPLEEFIVSLEEPEVQLEILRPIPPTIENGDEWKFPILTSYRDVLAQDDEILFPYQAPAADPQDRFGLGGGGAATGQDADVDRRNTLLFVEGDKLLKQALDFNAEADATRAYNIYLRIFKDAESSTTDKQKAKRKMEEAEQAERDIARRKRRFGRGQPVVMGGDEDDAPARERLPEQQIWVIDSGVDAVKGGTKYQYRMRLTLLNRLVGDPPKFSDPADAGTVYVRGPWSEPSDPVVVPNEVEYYIATEDPRDKEIGIKIFRWFEGVWVESRKFNLGVGDLVRGTVRTEVPDLADRTIVDRAQVEFETGMAVLDIDFGRRLRERKRGSGRNGVRFGDRAKGVCCVALVGPDGELVERFLPVDKDDPSQRAAQARKWTPAK